MKTGNLPFLSVGKYKSNVRSDVLSCPIPSGFSPYRILRCTSTSSCSTITLVCPAKTTDDKNKDKTTVLKTASHVVILMISLSIICCFIFIILIFISFLRALSIGTPPPLYILREVQSTFSPVQKVSDAGSPNTRKACEHKYKLPVQI